MTDDRYSVERAVRASELPAPSRHILLTLLTVVDNRTSTIPSNRTPSLTRIAEWTGLSRATVKNHLNRLEKSGWIKRSRSKNAPTEYRLAVPPAAPVGQEVARPGDSQASTWPSGRPGDGLGQNGHDESSQVGGRPGDGLGQEVAPSNSKSNNSSTNSPSSRTTKAGKPPPAEPPRDDVDQLCTRLRDWMLRNEVRKTPEKISDEWRREARLLLDRDKVALDEAIRVLDYCQQDQFWSQNIHSMPKFRKQFPKLEMKARRGHPGNGRSVGANPSLFTEEDYASHDFH